MELEFGQRGQLTGRTAGGDRSVAAWPGRDGCFRRNLPGSLGRGEPAETTSLLKHGWNPPHTGSIPGSADYELHSGGSA